MKTFARNLILSAAVAAATIAAVSPVSARDRYRDHRPRDYHHHHHNNNDAVVLGAAGLAAGVLLGTAIASQPRYVEPAPVYVDPEPIYDEPVPVYRDSRPVYAEEGPEYYPVRPRNVSGGSLRPWSAGWYEYCTERYRSFNAKTGTYVGYDGQKHFCTAG
ncbi:BA14K family protein [Rhizobiaceae bacterium n13]|uniref:Lectin-like protein BA14k n=1 Tax=Ferirhizobium litorale TaxID=2927786 RepID=A0AAE3QCX0_9HYPH|nr:BA14K family protein [Fererhizobium litorale]MDI7860903.1 BA14K family protein [Fererhizobium litorale]MDI7921051.1 BA14K family protein [Fererhizobium litorale]